MPEDKHLAPHSRQMVASLHEGTTIMQEGSDRDISLCGGVLIDDVMEIRHVMVILQVLP